MASRGGARGKGEDDRKKGVRSSRRKFLKRVAYAAPAIITFVASPAHAQQTTCAPADCRPVDCRPGDCTPGPCPPIACPPNN